MLLELLGLAGEDLLAEDRGSLFGDVVHDKSILVLEGVYAEVEVVAGLVANKEHGRVVLLFVWLGEFNFVEMEIL